MSSPAERLLELLSLLQARPRWTAPELAERLGTTERTVRRDVTRLRELGYPVVADAGRTGGYRLGAGGGLPPLLLTDDEAVAVAIGLRVAAGIGIDGVDEAAVASLAKLEQVLPTRLRERVRALDAATVHVHGRRVGPSVEPELLLLIAQACRGCERLRFGYVDGDGVASERRVEPYGLVSVDHRWYLVAHDLDRADWRNFRVDRMHDAALAGHRFVRRSEPDLEAMVLTGLTVAAYPWQAEIFVHADADELAYEVAPSTGTLEPTDGGTILRLGANDLAWIARFLAGLPFEFEVRSPAELRRAIRDHARTLRQRHR